MAHIIIKQPNKKYCIFSTIVDSIIYYDLDRDELVDTILEEKREDVKEWVAKAIEKPTLGAKMYGIETYEDMLNKIKDVHGDQEYNEIIKLTGKNKDK
jgi:hypothetical protein